MYKLLWNMPAATIQVHQVKIFPGGGGPALDPSLLMTGGWHPILRLSSSPLAVFGCPVIMTTWGVFTYISNPTGSLGWEFSTRFPQKFAKWIPWLFHDWFASFHDSHSQMILDMVMTVSQHARQSQTRKLPLPWEQAIPWLFHDIRLLSMAFWEILIFQDFSRTFHDSNFFQDFPWPWEPCLKQFECRHKWFSSLVSSPDLFRCRFCHWLCISLWEEGVNWSEVGKYFSNGSIICSQQDSKQ